MSKKSCFLVSVVLVLSLAGVASAVVTETFDSDLGRLNDVVGNQTGGQDWGWSDSDNAGGASGPGELGGLFVRAKGPHAWDTTIGTFDASDTLVLQGSALMENINWDGGILVGYFNQSSTTVLVGISLSEGSPGPRIFMTAGSGWTLATQVSYDRQFSWDLTYASGTLSGTIAGQAVNFGGTPGTMNAFGVALDTDRMRARVSTHISMT